MPSMMEEKMGIDLKELTISASIKKKALQHYDEMIAFAKKQKAYNIFNRRLCRNILFCESNSQIGSKQSAT